jgi:hypothetical protein
MPFVAADISAVARALNRELQASPEKPGHVQIMNILARAAGYRNFQHLKAQGAAERRLAEAPSPIAPPDHQLVERTLRHFDAHGRLLRWPSRASHRQLCLWALWAGMPAGRSMTEATVNDVLRKSHLFGDPALLRRLLCDSGLLVRTRDCREYRRVERSPSADARALIRQIGLRTAASRFADKG